MKFNDQKPCIPHLTVVASYYNPKIGGLETVAHTLASAFQKSGSYEVSVITSNYDSHGYRKDIIDGVTVHRLPVWFKLSNTPINPLWKRQIESIFDQEKPDLVHTHSPVPFMADLAVKAAYDRGIPVVATYHAGSMRKGRLLIDILISAYESFFLPKLFQRANTVVTVHQEFMRRSFPQFANKTFFVPTGIDLNRFGKSPLMEETKTVTFVGRLERTSSWKGIEELLRAMVIVINARPDTKLEIIGDGDAFVHYKARARELGIEKSVIMPGILRGTDLINGYGRATMVVLPSTSDSEAFSVALLEAMASGRPIIGTKIGGTPQVIDDGENGFLVPPKNPKALAVAIMRILDNPTLAKNLGDSGVKKARSFSWDAQIAKYKAIFEGVSRAKMS